MGRFFGPAADLGIVSGGTFGGGGTVSGQFMVVGANNVNPTTASAGGAALRDANGTWHVVDVTSLGARGLLGVSANQVSGPGWIISANAHPGNAFIGNLADGSLTAVGIDTGIAALVFSDNNALASAPGVGVFVFGTLGNIVVTTPDLTTFTQHPAHGPGSYTIMGVGVLSANFAVVGLGSAGNGICTSPDAFTWTSSPTNFSTSPDISVTSNTLTFDGVQYLAVGANLLATSPNGLSWSTTNISGATSTATVITFDSLGGGKYYMGDQGGNVYVSATAAGLATASPIHLSAHPIRCATTAFGIALVGDSAGNIFSSSNGGVTWQTENPGLGALVLTSLANSQTFL
jgi:hypothetical protein